MIYRVSIKVIRKILVCILDKGIINTTNISSINHNYNRILIIMLKNDLIRKHDVRFSGTLHKAKLNRHVYSITRKGIRYMYLNEKIDLHN